MTHPFCSGGKSEGFCTKVDQCALYRKWWEGHKTEMVLCKYKKHDRFIPIKLAAAAPQAIHSMPIGRTLELFA